MSDLIEIWYSIFCFTLFRQKQKKRVFKLKYEENQTLDKKQLEEGKTILLAFPDSFGQSS